VLVVVIIYWHDLFGVHNKALMIISAKSKVKTLHRVVVIAVIVSGMLFKILSMQSVEHFVIFQ